MSDSAARLSIRFHESTPFQRRHSTAEKLGVAYAALLEAIADGMGHEVAFQARTVEWRCDGEECERETETLEGWTRRDDGADLCPECSA